MATSATTEGVDVAARQSLKGSKDELIDAANELIEVLEGLRGGAIARSAKSPPKISITGSSSEKEAWKVEVKIEFTLG